MPWPLIKPYVYILQLQYIIFIFILYLLRGSDSLCDSLFVFGQLYFAAQVNDLAIGASY